MVDVLQELLDAANHVIRAARGTFIDKELGMWLLPCTSENLMPFVSKKLEDSRADLSKDAVLVGNGGKALINLVEASPVLIVA
ncbi:unnamed protein product [Auanema sp. JU1783]|nr:unnamed protein product [Auanema sp. JU1783]